MKWLSVICALTLAGPVSAQTQFTITTGSLPNATVQLSYSQQLTSSGGVAPVTWSVSGNVFVGVAPAPSSIRSAATVAPETTATQSGLPPGLSLSSSGAITGIPTQAGSFSFGVTARDARGNTAFASFTLTVQLPPLAITTGSPLPGGTVGAAYSATLTATGGTGVYSWSSSGSLPPGLSFSSTPPTGRISGTPTAGGVYQFTISVGDSQEHTAVKQFTLTIQSLPLSITSVSPLPNGAVGVPYTFSLEGNGGVKPYLWSVTGSVPPDGLTLASNGALSGTPTAVGQYTFTVRAVDSAPGQGQQTVNKVFNLRITAPLSVTTPSPINATLGAAITVVMTATGGTPQYLWSVAPGSQLPSGFTLDTASGFLTGTPTTAGTFNFTVRATDSVQNTATKALSLIVQALTITTASPAPNASVGVSYSLTLTVNGGAAPFIWALDSGALPAGLTLNPATGVISGTPQSAAPASFVIRVTDNAKLTVTKSFTLTVVNLAPVLISPNTLDFFAFAGGDAPTPQSFALNTAAAQALQFTIQVDGGAAGVLAPAWLLVRLLKGSSPARIPVAVDPTGLEAGKYTARILVNFSDGRQNIVTVTLTMTVAPPQLDVSPDNLRFAGSPSALAASEQDLLVRNTGGGGLLPFQARVSDDAPWLTVIPAAGQAGPNAPALLRVLVNAQGLPLGPARGLIRVASDAGAADIPVSLLVREEGPVIGFNLTGLRFDAREGHGSTRSKNVNVLNLGSGVVNWQAEIVSGAEFVSLDATTGAATPIAPSILAFSVNPGALKSGNYYALIKISAPLAVNSPQFLTALLAIADEGSPPDPDPTPSGLFFVGKATGVSPPAQTIRVFTSSATSVPFQISANTADGRDWLSASPSSGSASTSNPALVNVTVTPGVLSPGIYSGDVTVALANASIRAVNVILVVQPATTVTASKARDAIGCTPAKLALTQTGLVNSFAAPAGWPSPLVVRLADDCGDPVLNGQVVATFSNGDPALVMKLTDRAIGLYSATWAPGKVSTQITVSARAAAPNLASATGEITGTVTSNKVPVMAPNGTRNTFNPLVGAPLAPGMVAQVYGSSLAATQAAPGVIPLPFRFNGTRVLIGAFEAPLIFLSDSQLSVQIPTELPPNKDYSLVVEANGGYTLPDTLTIAAAQPGVLTLSDKSLFALHGADYSPVTAASPARQGETIVVYLVGMGGTNPAIASGVPAPSDQPATAATQPGVTIDGKTAMVSFAGLTPGSVGLYQILVTTPAGMQAGSVPVTITQGGFAANASMLWVR